MGRVAAATREAPELVPGGLATAGFVALAAAEGGYLPHTWYPAALFAGALLAVTALALGRAGRLAPEPGRLLAAGLLASFCAWAYASIAWADVPATAWEGANQALLYVTVFALFAVLPWRAWSAAGLLCAHSLAIAAVAAVALASAAGAADPELELLRGRFVEPTGYHNAAAALYLASFFPALLFASRRETPVWARGPLLAAAGVLLLVALLPQSRGSAIAFPIACLAFLAVAPGRARVILCALPVAVAALLAQGPLLDVYEASVEGGDLAAALDDAWRAVTSSALVLLVLGLAIGAADRRVRAPDGVARGVSMGVGAVAALALLAAAAIFVSAVGNPASWAQDRWDEFKSGDPGLIEEGSRFGATLGSNRYDFWRVAMDSFAEAPLAGAGMSQFAEAYVRERRSDEEPGNPHSFPVKVLSQTGLVGTVLFAGFLVAAAVAALLARIRAGNTAAGAVAAAGLAYFAYWFVHGAGDWLWEFPGLAAPALAWLAIAGGVHRGPGEPEGRSVATPALAVAAVAVAIPTLALVPPWGAARDVEIAATNWPANPGAAFERLDRARELNPLSDEPDTVAGTIAIRMGDERLAAERFAQAVERNERSWYAQLMLGTLRSLAGERRAGLEHLRRAAALVARDPLTDEALRTARAGEPLKPREIDRELTLRVCSRIGRTEATPECD